MSEETGQPERGTESEDRFAEEVLVSREEVLFTTRSHVLTVVKPLVLWSLFLVAGAALLWMLRENEYARLVLVAWIVVGVSMLAYHWLGWRRDTVRVTNLRLYRARGIFNKEFFSDELRSITNVELELPLLGRLLGFGNLNVYTASAESARRRFDMIRHPRELHQVITDAKARADEASIDQLERLLAARQERRTEGAARRGTRAPGERSRLATWARGREGRKSPPDA